MPARSNRLEDHRPMPQFSGLTPVFLVIADHGMVDQFVARLRECLRAQ